VPPFSCSISAPVPLSWIGNKYYDPSYGISRQGTEQEFLASFDGDLSGFWVMLPAITLSEAACGHDLNNDGDMDDTVPGVVITLFNTNPAGVDVFVSDRKDL